MVQHLTVQAAFELLQQGKAVLIDVREADEFQQERIPGALLLPLSGLTIESFQELSIDESQTLIVQCRSGGRSARACTLLESMVDHSEIYNLEGGILEWKNKGLPTNLSPSI